MTPDDELKDLEASNQGESDSQVPGGPLPDDRLEGEGRGLEEVFEMEVAEDDICAYLVDEDDNEIGFVLVDEDGNEQEYYYVDMDAYEIVEEEGAEGKARPARASDADDEFDLGITREGVAEATADMNAIYRDGAAVAAELKETMEEINEGLSFLKKRR